VKSAPRWSRRSSPAATAFRTRSTTGASSGVTVTTQSSPRKMPTGEVATSSRNVVSPRASVAVLKRTNVWSGNSSVLARTSFLRSSVARP